MKDTSWKDIAELVGISAIVASLIFVGIELRQAQQVALNEAGTFVFTGEITANSEINENADVWAKGLAGTDLTPGESVIFHNLVIFEYSRSFWAWNSRRNLGLPAGLPPINFATFLYLNPSARAVWEEEMRSREKYRNPLVIDGPVVGTIFEFPAIIRSHIEELQQTHGTTPP